ncbi:MAG: zinc ribbon domain-containing protein [Gallionella sp.]|nr:zinc ribbon domain-containing protein [Gallionella sp.]MDP1941329.1 zinc ribbon domain-containing protein [Gallionella sp.]
MPIYAYGCSSCGLQKDVMQKMSDEPLKVCPECGKETYSKQLTAPGFQLKGNGYYATDFKDQSKSGCAPCGSASSCPVANS